MIPVKYIGHRNGFVDAIYGTGIAFERNQTVNIDDESVTRKMLRHADVYVRGDAEEAEKPEKVASNPATQDEDPDQTVRDSIAAMNKDALKTYAFTTFNIELDKRMSLADMRSKVTGLFDQFGAE